MERPVPFNTETGNKGFCKPLQKWPSVFHMRVPESIPEHKHLRRYCIQLYNYRRLRRPAWAATIYHPVGHQMSLIS